MPKAKKRPKKPVVQAERLPILSQSRSSVQLPEIDTKPSPLTWIPDAAEQLLYTKDDNIRFLAARWFLKCAPEITSYAPHFAGSLALAAQRDSNYNVRKVALEALGALGSAAAAQASSIESILLKSPYEQIREAAATALGSVGKDSSTFPQAKALRTAALNDSGLSVRNAAARSLAGLDAAATAGTLEELACEMVQGMDPVVRCRALAAFSFLGEKAEPYAEMFAGAAINDSAVGVRMAAVETITALGDVAKSGVLHLVATLQHEDALSRKAATRALATIGYTAPPTPPPSPPKEDDWNRRTFTKKKKKKKHKTNDSEASTAKLPKQEHASPKSPSKAKVMSEEAVGATGPSSKSKGKITSDEAIGDKGASPKSKAKVTSEEAVGDKGPSPKKKTPRKKGKGSDEKDGSTADKRPQGRAKGLFRQEEPLEPAVPPPTPPLFKAGTTLAAMAMYDDDMMVRYRAGEALSSFGRACSPQLRAMALTTLNDKSADVRVRASEALGRLDLNMRSTHASTFSDLIATTQGRPMSRCGTADIISQNRAVAALRDLGTAAQPHRPALNAVVEDQRCHAGARLEATRTLNELGRRCATPTPDAMAHMRHINANLRAEAAELMLHERCCTPATNGAEVSLMLRARLYEERGPPMF